MRWKAVEVDQKSGCGFIPKLSDEAAGVERFRIDGKPALCELLKPLLGEVFVPADQTHQAHQDKIAKTARELATAVSCKLRIQLLVIGLAAPCFAADTALWDATVKEYVTAEARVDYARLKANGRPKLDEYLRQIAAGPAKDKATLINAYNALTVRWVLDHYPVKSIWQTPHPFSEKRHIVNGEKLSLDDIEGQLRKMGDPRIHGALVCAARSCPPLRREAYTADHVEAQLDDNVRQWLANEKLNQFEPAQRTARVSSIFKWYKGDFDAAAGSVQKFLAKFAPPGKGAFLLEAGVAVKFNDYGWGLNDSSELGSDYSKFNLFFDHRKNK